MKIEQSAVGFRREELDDMIKTYEMISDCLHGEKAIKKRNVRYLPLPSECDNIGHPRYVAYQTRANFFNVTLPTRDALVGQIFLREPIIKVPTRLEPMIKRVNDEGLTFTQLLMKAANTVLPYGRGGFLTDFPATNGEVTKGQLDKGEIKPTIRFFEPWAIRNWYFDTSERVGKLVLLVLDEPYEVLASDGFSVQVKIRQRVYKLKNEVCRVSIYEDRDEKKTFIIKDSTGAPMKEIPFEFVGSENNDADIDEPPFYNMANLNIAHYRNSADYEESVYLVGQPTPVYSGLTEDWMENYFPKGVRFGSRASITLPEGGQAELLQAQPNMIAFEAMVHKEEQMIKIGAKLVQGKSTVERKQAEIEIDAASQRSVLTTIKDNLQLAAIASLKRAAAFVGESEEEIVVSLNDNFDLTTMTAEQIRYVIELYATNGIAFSEFRENLRRSGLAKLNDEEARSEIEADQEMKKKLAPEVPEGQGNTVGTKPTPGGTTKPKPKTATKKATK